MKKFEINAYSYDEAKAKALEYGMTIVRNVTPSFKKEMPVDFDEFAERMLVKNHLENANGVGCVVVLESGSADTRERPYEYVNNVVEGKLTKKRIFEVRTVKNDVLIGEAETKSDAAKIAKTAMKEVKEDIYCRQIYKIVGEKGLAFNLNYVPSVNTKEGRYIVFGN